MNPDLNGTEYYYPWIGLNIRKGERKGKGRTCYKCFYVLYLPLYNFKLVYISREYIHHILFSIVGFQCPKCKWSDAQEYQERKRLFNPWNKYEPSVHKVRIVLEFLSKLPITKKKYNH